MSLALKAVKRRMRKSIMATTEPHLTRMVVVVVKVVNEVKYDNVIFQSMM